MKSVAWRAVPLGACCQIVSGGTPSRTVPEYWDGNIPWATPKDLSSLDEPVLRETYEKISAAGYRSSSATLLPKGSILFSSRAPIGLVGIAGMEMCTNQGFKSLVPGEGVDSGYLYWCMKRMAPRIADLGTGATFKEVSKAVMERVSIPLPPISEQKRIAVVLDKAGAIRRKRQQALALSNEVLRSEFLEMFGDPASNPKKWNRKPISRLARVITGNTPARAQREFYGGSLEWIKSDNINTPQHVVTPAEEHLSELGRSRARIVGPGATLVTCIAGSAECIGNSAMTDREVAFNQQINALQPHEGVDPYFLYCQIHVGKRLVQRASTNSMKGMVSKTRLEAVELVSPPEELQADFGRWFGRWNKLWSRATLGEQLADQLFDSLSQRAFNGGL